MQFCREDHLFNDAIPYCITCCRVWNLNMEVDSAVTVVQWLLTLVRVTNSHVLEDEKQWQSKACEVLQNVMKKAPSLSLLTMYTMITDCLLNVATFAKQADEIQRIYDVLMEACSSMLRDYAITRNSRPMEYVIQNITSQLPTLTLYEYVM